MALNIKFYCRECKKDGIGLSPVEVSLILNGKRAVLTLPMRYNPTRFSKELKKGKGIKDYVETMTAKITHYAQELEKEDRFTLQELREAVKNGGVRARTLGDVADEFMAVQRKRVGVKCGKQQYRKYEIILEKLFKKMPRTTRMELIRRGDIEDWIADLGKEYKPASLAGMLTRAKAVFTWAKDNGYISVNPFSFIEIERGKPREEWLDDSEMDRIRSLKLDGELEVARQMFLFQCASGMSYSDMQSLKKEDIRSENGVVSVLGHRCKTGVPFVSVVLPEGVEMLEKWDYRIPRKSSQKYNLCLLKIETKAGLRKHLHSHLGRKVYGCTLLRKQVSMKAVSKALGHSNIQITQSTYAFLQNEDVIREIANKAI